MIPSFFSSIRARLLLLVLVAILPALGQSLYTEWEQRQEATAEARARVLRIARRLSLTENAFIDGAHHLLLGLAELPEVRRHDSSACSARFSRLHKELPAYTSLIATKPNGDLFCSSIPYAGPLNFADRLWFQKVVETRAFSTGEYVIGRITGKPVLLMAYPVLDKAGQVRAVVGASLDLAWFNRFGADTGLSPKSNFIVFDTTGLVLGYYPEPEKWAGKSVRTTPLYRTISPDKDGGIAEMAGPDGISRIYASASVGKTGGAIDAYVAVGIPAEELFGEVHSVFTRNLALVLIIALVAFAATWFTGELSIRRPVSQVVSAAKELAAGNFKYRASVDRVQGELGQLGHTFNEMAESLERQIAEREQAKEKILKGLQRIEALREIDRAITSTLDLRGVLALLLEKIDFALPYSAAAIMLWNKEHRFLEPVACRNIDENEWKKRFSRGPTLALTVLETKAPVVVRNLQTDPRTRDPGFARQQGIVSFLGIPLVVKDEAIGVLAFYTREEHEFTDDEVEFLSALANQAAIAVHNAQLYEETLRRGAELKETHEHLVALHGVTVAASQSLDLDAVLQEIIKQITDIFKFDATRIFLFNNDKSELRLRASYERVPEYFDSVRSVLAGQGTVGRVAETGEPLILDDIQSSPLYQETSLTKVMQRAGYHFFAALPIKAKLRTVGSLICMGENPRNLNPGEHQLLMSMTGQIGIAVENASLFEETLERAKELQQKTLELEKAITVKDEFLSVMSHELRTPLNVVMGYAGMLKDRMLGETNHEQERALEKILSQSKDQLGMINNILQTTQIEAGAEKIEVHEMALTQLLEGLKSDYELSLSKDLGLIWDYPSGLPLMQTDGGKLKQILQNLINNAIKFTHKGHVAISVRHDLASETVEFRVEDTGVGIPADMIIGIFEKFRQVDSSETRLYGGVGMGLYIVKRFTEMLGGKIEVESEVGKGSTFTVRIPLAFE
ncbi:MAG: hypothetical protein A2038_11260 [Deltaproteobacteria bacterium GWA2_57_13]|nr:MAG: hypothetical protein A2038_11260 [Deltaproteobacteria bacterium GWA2_57_13]